MAKTTKKDSITFYGTGRRKKSIARVRLIEGGKGTITKLVAEELNLINIELWYYGL